MTLSNILSEKTVAINLEASDKTGIIKELLDILVKANLIQDKETAFKAVMERESAVSTGMKYGIAIPHGKTVVDGDLVACVGISKNPIDFDSMDGEPSRIFIMTLSPPYKTGPHLQFLAEVSTLFKSPEKRNAAIAATSAKELLEVITKN